MENYNNIVEGIKLKYPEVTTLWVIVFYLEREYTIYAKKYNVNGQQIYLDEYFYQDNELPQNVIIKGKGSMLIAAPFIIRKIL